jgi:DNA-binding beta-propeller fold protein YncE
MDRRWRSSYGDRCSPRRRPVHGGASLVWTVLGLLSAAAIVVALPAGAGASPARAAATGDLAFDACFGTGTGCTSVPGNPLQNARGVVVSRNGSVYATGFVSQENSVGSGFVTHFFTGPGGKLSYDGCVSDDGTGGHCADIPGTSTPLLDPSGLAVSPNGGSVYVSSFLSNTLSHFFADKTQGQLKWDACESPDGSGGSCIKAPQTGTGAPLGFPTDVAVSPNGSAPNSSVYVVSLGALTFSSLDGTVAHVFADPDNGQLNWDGCISNAGSTGTCAALPGPQPARTGSLTIPASVAVNPSGTAVYVLAGGSDILSRLDLGEGTILQFSALPSSGGGLTKLVGCLSDNGSNGCTKVSANVAPLTHPGGVTVSPDGSSVYVAAGVGVSHFYADPKGSGVLSFDGCVSDDGSGGGCTKGPQTGTPLKGADALAVSPDGRSLYLVSTTALSWFSVAPQGQLTFQGCISDAAVPGCTDEPAKSLGGADGVAVSPDGGSVYVTSPEGITHFVRTQPSRAGTGGSGSTGGGSSGGTGASAGGTTTPTGIPTLSSLKIAPHAFRAAPGGPSVIVQSSSRLGGKLSYRLDVAARVSFAIQHSVPGRKQQANGKTRCVAQTAKNAHAKACVRVVKLGSFTETGAASTNTFRISGRLNGRALTAGSYSLVAIPRTTGKAGHPITTTFSIKP